MYQLKRKDALAYMRIAGYHNDRAAFTRLYIENRVSRQAADEAWYLGAKQKEGGVKCACYKCKSNSKN